MPFPRAKKWPIVGQSLLTRTNFIIAAVTGSLLLGVVFFSIDNRTPQGDLFEEAFSRLERIREAKKRSVIGHIEKVHRLAREIKDDPVMARSFQIMEKPDYITDEDLEYLVDRHWAANYGDFYDILFVNAQGTVFHSIRKEADYQTNLFSGPLAETKLSQKMAQSPVEHFVDYEYYSPSEEPAAFFATPVEDQGTHGGWFVLQCPINRLDTILRDRQGLGRTGEVYLVNKDKWMLTDSRFIEDRTTLRLKVDTKAVQEALKKGVGTSIIEDYRGVRVLSAYERFDVFGTTWIVICELDEDEAITEYYAKRPDFYNEKILVHLARQDREGTPRKLPDHERIRVDLNEYAKAEPGQRLETYGVATCTAVAVSYPGRFAYLAHIGPKDAIYESGGPADLFDLGRKSDLLGELIGRIQHYDIYPYELRNLQFTIVAPHDASFGNVVKRLVAHGIGLGSIKLIWSPEGGYANVVVDPAEDLVAVVWEGGGTGDARSVVDGATVEDLGSIVKKLAIGQRRGRKPL